MATGETGFEDVFYDLVSVQYHSLKAGHDYGQYVRDADNAGEKEIADFFREVMDQDSKRAARCHEFLKRLTGTEQAGPAAQRSPDRRTAPPAGGGCGFALWSGWVQTVQVSSVHPSAAGTVISGCASAHARSRICSSSSAGWAPAAPYFRSTTKNGTPVAPRAWAVAASSRTAAR